MKHLQYFVVLALAFEPSVSYADILWDNGDWEGASNLSSERNTSIPESWVVDDVVLTEPIIIRQFEWLSIMSLDLNVLGADLVVLTDDFQVVSELPDLQFSRVYQGDAYGMEIYLVTLSDLSIALAPGNYYIGGRMVGDGQGRAVSGMNSTIRGNTPSYFQSDYFGFPEWTLYAPLDLSFKVYGDIIPAPPTLFALALPGLLALRRRR